MQYNPTTQSDVDQCLEVMWIPEGSQGESLQTQFKCILNTLENATILSDIK